MIITITIVTIIISIIIIIITIIVITIITLIINFMIIIIFISVIIVLSIINIIVTNLTWSIAAASRRSRAPASSSGERELAFGAYYNTANKLTIVIIITIIIMRY